jgi:hypothetical protein
VKAEAPAEEGPRRDDTGQDGDDVKDAVNAARDGAPTKIWTGKLLKLIQKSSAAGPRWWITGADQVQFFTDRRPHYTAANTAYSLGATVEVKYREAVHGNEMLDVKGVPR